MARNRSARLCATIAVLAMAASAFAVACVSGRAPQEPPPSPGALTDAFAVEPISVQGFASVAIREVVEPRLSRVSIVPSHAIVPAGQRIVFSAIAYDQKGRALEGGEVHWSMKDSLAGSISPGGVFRAALQSGRYIDAVAVSVTHEFGGELAEFQALATVSIPQLVSEQEISRVQVLPGKVQVEPDARFQLIALDLDRAGVPVPDVVFRWETVDPAAGAIDEQGRLVAGSEPGLFPAAVRVLGHRRNDPSQTIAATASVEIRRIEIPDVPSKVSVYPQAISLRPGDSVAFRTLALDGQGNLYERVDISWTLKDSRAGALDGDGLFQASSQPGTYQDSVEVTVTPQGVEPSITLKAAATVTVLKPRPIGEVDRLQRAVISQPIVRLRPGESTGLTATALSGNGLVLRRAAVRWSGTPEVVEVTPEGRVTAREMPGTYRDAIVVELEHEGAILSAAATLIILGPLAQVEVVPVKIVVAPNQLLQFTHIAYDVNGVRLFDTAATWELTDEAAGTIDDLGLFVAGSIPGEYANVVKVMVTQR